MKKTVLITLAFLFFVCALIVSNTGSINLLLEIPKQYFDSSQSDSSVPVDEAGRRLTEDENASDDKAPSIPSNLQLVEATSSSVEISWDPSVDKGSAGMGGYRVFKDGELYVDNIDQNDAPVFVDLGVKEKSAYTYAVSAFDNAQPRNTSALRQIKVRTPPVDDEELSIQMVLDQNLPDDEAPSIPSNLQLVEATHSSVEISWDPSVDKGAAGIGGYRLFKDGELYVDNIAQSESPVFVDLDVSEKSAYTYALSAFDKAQPPNMSPLRQIKVRMPSKDQNAPGTPSELKVLDFDSSTVTLSWNESADIGQSGLRGYLIYRNGKLLGRVSEPWFQDVDLVEQSSYTYMISSVDDADPPNESSKRTVTVTTQSLLDTGR